MTEFASASSCASRDGFQREIHDYSGRMAGLKKAVDQLLWGVGFGGSPGYFAHFPKTNNATPSSSPHTMEAVDPDEVLALRPPSLLEVLDDRQVRTGTGGVCTGSAARSAPSRSCADYGTGTGTAMHEYAPDLLRSVHTQSATSHHLSLRLCVAGSRERVRE